jgi:hypothetical protein
MMPSTGGKKHVRRGQDDLGGHSNMLLLGLTAAIGWNLGLRQLFLRFVSCLQLREQLPFFKGVLRFAAADEELCLQAT